MLVTPLRRRAEDKVTGVNLCFVPVSPEFAENLGRRDGCPWVWFRTPSNNMIKRWFALSAAGTPCTLSEVYLIFTSQAARGIVAE